ncbi:arylsulfatase [Algibacillus agarilyticus]|uniref:arylsulfatase n=1 Tax=Algibacillus agarilyticus TaxID=2234133 RepID=UPI001E3435EB|nr:arylsulfatase [Algibacillus agarilyticus]
MKLLLKKQKMLIPLLTGLLLFSGCKLANQTTELLTEYTSGSEHTAQKNKLPTATKPTKKPNIVMVVTDDQGYGDIGFNANPIVQTPNLDALAQVSTRLTNFHVDPTCSPTRAALLTGKHSLKAGVWHTILGRYMLGPEHKTLAEYLSEAGYHTGIFGKWHLGDNYPYRPQDQGFDNVVIHGGGGVGQTPDYWGNTQFNDTYYRNGEPEKFSDYATKVWFDEAIEHIKEQGDTPHLTYIALNAPHGPYRAPKNYIKPYEDRGITGELARFYAMITYIDDQVARLRAEIDKLGQTDNTIFIFMTDNGSSYRSSYHGKLTPDTQGLRDQYPTWQPNAGLSGFKGDILEGGHKVPFVISYPDGQLQSGALNALSAHYDLLPTLLELADIKINEPNLDGKSLVKLLKQGKDNSLNTRDVFITNQRVFDPSVDRPTVLAHNHWRYLRYNQNTKALFNINVDPAQKHNVIADYPRVAEYMEAKIQNWFSDLAAKGFKDRYIHVGNAAEHTVRLNAMDWMEVPNGQAVPWFIGHQAAADEYDYVHWLTEEDKYKALPWYINVEQAGIYQIKPYFHDKPAATPILKKYCVVQINERKVIGKVYGRASHCEVNIDLKLGQQKITAWFTDTPEAKRNINNKTQTKNKAAFYVYLTPQFELVPIKDKTSLMTILTNEEKI